MSPSVIALLRAVHVLAGAFWVGGMLLLTGFVLPAIRASGPAGGQVMRTMVQVRRLPVYLNIAVGLAVLSGLTLFWWTSGGFSHDWLSSGSGRTSSGGGARGIVAAIIGGVVSGPTAARIGRLGAAIQASGAPPTPEQSVELQRLQRRLDGAARVVTVLIVGTALCMGAARYL